MTAPPAVWMSGMPPSWLSSMALTMTADERRDPHMAFSAALSGDESKIDRRASSAASSFLSRGGSPDARHR